MFELILFCELIYLSRVQKIRRRILIPPIQTESPHLPRRHCRHPKKLFASKSTKVEGGLRRREIFKGGVNLNSTY